MKHVLVQWKVVAFIMGLAKFIFKFWPVIEKPFPQWQPGWVIPAQVAKAP